MKKSFGLFCLANCLLLLSCGDVTVSLSGSVSLNQFPSSSSVSESLSLPSSPSSSSSVAPSSSAAEVFTVSFLNYDSTLLGTDEVKKGETAVYEGTAPVKDGDDYYTYAFDGWDKNLANVQSSFSTTAQYKRTAVEYLLTVSANNDSLGSVTGGGKYQYGASVSLKATSKEGNAFIGWYEGETLVSKIAEYVFSMPKKELTYIGKFAAAHYVDASSNDASKGTVTGSGYYSVGDKVELKAAPLDPLYGAVSWRDGEGVNLATGLTYSFIMSTSDVKVVAYFDIGTGSKIKVGNYPQGKVEDTALCTSLTELAGTLPTAAAPNSWTDYGYYIGNGNKEPVQTSYMWYQDVEKDGDKYRGVYFTEYRPFSTYRTSEKNYQEANGYVKNAVHWFKFEPVEWNVLTSRSGKFLLMSSLLLDSQPFENTYHENMHDYKGASVYCNNYAASYIRKWINSSFYDTAFASEDKPHIATTAVNNSGANIYVSSNPFGCETTSDKMFLMSYMETINTDYGFNSKRDVCAARAKKITDYSHSQGIFDKWTGESEYHGYGAYYLRTPNEVRGGGVYTVGPNGFQSEDIDTDEAQKGLAPCMWYSPL